MIRFLCSIEFWVTTVLVIIMSFVLGKGDFTNGFNDIANIKQNLDWYAWAYVIYRLHRHHTLISTLKDNDKTNDGKSKD
jgi:hypothetical protein